MVAGATGTGKTVSLMVLAEGFSRLGVPVLPGRRQGRRGRAWRWPRANPATSSRRAWPRSSSTDWKPQANPVVFWDLYGKLGHPVRATISEMGPTLLGRMLELNDTQEGVLDIVFKLADDQGLLLLDLDDLRALLDLRRRERQGHLDPVRPGQHAEHRARSSARCCGWSRTAPSSSSASRRWNWPT